MKIREDLDLENLRKYGFKTIKEMRQNSELPEIFEYNNDDTWVYEIGHSRRGQYYYLLIIDKEIYIEASKPDGDGCFVLLPDILLKMFEDKNIT